MGSKIHQDFIPDEEAEVVGKLKEAGVVIIGKHNLHEYAWGVTNDNPHFGPARNPWNPSKITGGSSGGSAARSEERRVGRESRSGGWREQEKEQERTG